MPKRPLKLEDLYNPTRFQETATLHRMAFQWRSQGRIPLGIHVVVPDRFSGLSYDDWLNPEAFLDLQTKILIDTLSVGSDLLPVVAINHLGRAVITSMFGARQHFPEFCGTSLQDVGPSPLPVFKSIEDVNGLEMPGMDTGIVTEMIEFARNYRKNLPDWVGVIAPMPSGPFSVAMELRGSEMLCDMLEHPNLCRRLIDMCARLQVSVELSVRDVTRMPQNEHITNFGILGVGLRLGEDSMVTISPSMIKEFCVPAFRAVNGLCGGLGHIHFCSLVHSRNEHIYQALAESPEVAVVSSQFGFEYYEAHLNELRRRLAVESFYGDAQRYVCDKYGSFREWAFDFVPRFKDESGLVLYCQVESVEQGKDMWATWQEAHRKST